MRLDFRRWKICREGVTAIEFSLLAVPFVFFVIGTIELSIMMAANALLDASVADAARLIRTGQVQQTDSDPKEMFKEALCDGASVLLDCETIQYSVETIASFGDANPAPDVNDDGEMEAPPFDPGGSGDIVLIKTTYLYPLVTPWIGGFFSDYPGNKRLMSSSVVLQTEPYEAN